MESQLLKFSKEQLEHSLVVEALEQTFRRLCVDCRKSITPTSAQLHTLGFTPTAGTVYSAQACAACNRSGYRGRTGIYELLTVDDGLRRLIHDRASEQTLREHVVNSGMRSLREDGMRWVTQGVTSLEEVVRVTRE